MSSRPNTFFGWVGFILDEYGTLFLSGVGVTLLVAITGTLIGFIIGLLVAILRTIPVAPRDRGSSVCPSRCFPRCSTCISRYFAGRP